MKYRIRLVNRTSRSGPQWVSQVGWQIERKLRWWPWWFECGGSILYDTADDAMKVSKYLKKVMKEFNV